MRRKIIPRITVRQGEGHEEEYRRATEMLLLHIIKAPNVKIYEDRPIIHLAKGVQQGGCASPILYIAYADKFAQRVR